MNQEERLRVARTIYQYNCQRVRITASGHGLGMERARFRLMFNRVKCSADRYMAHLQEFIRDRFVAWSLGWVARAVDLFLVTAGHVVRSCALGVTFWLI